MNANGCVDLRDSNLRIYNPNVTQGVGFEIEEGYRKVLQELIKEDYTPVEIVVINSVNEYEILLDFEQGYRVIEISKVIAMEICDLLNLEVMEIPF